MSLPMLFCREMECSGVRSLGLLVDVLVNLERGEREIARKRGGCVHGCFVVRAEESHAFLCHLSELEEGDHLEAGDVVSG